MKFKHKTYLAVISALILSFLAIPVFAQSADVVTAEVDRRDLSTDEYLTLKVIINQAFGSISEPTLPPLDGFSLVGTSSSTNISIVNGVQSAEKIFIYTLQPSLVGNLEIGTVKVTVDGQDYYTNPISVNVTQGTGQPSSQPPAQSVPTVPGFPSIPSFPSIQGFPSITGLLKQFGLDVQMDSDLNVQQLDPSLLPPELKENDYLVEAEVDNPNPFLGEQITYTFRYYRPVESVGTQSYQPPDFSGFWVHSEPVENHYASQLAGRSIRMTEIKQVLLPTVIGEAEINPAQVTSEGDIFNRGFTIQTAPELVTVRSLPEGAPTGFTGAVGEFSINAEIDHQQTKINDAVTLKITINGAGNLETFADPEWEIGPQWRAFDSQSVTNAQLQDGIITGERTIEQVLVPTMAGDFTIPPIQFSYFDPNSETYQTIATEALEISVAPDGSVTAPVAIGNDPITGGSVADLLPLKDTLSPSSLPENLTQTAGFWLLWMVPLFLLIGQYGWHKRNEYIMKNPEAKRNQKAAKKAYQALKAVDINSPEYFSNVGRILTTYLSDKLNRPVAGLTQAELSGLLLAHGVSNQLVEQVRTCLTISELGQYAPIQGAGTKDVHLETKSLIAEIEKVL